MMELTKAQKRMLMAASAGGEHRVVDGYEMVTARSLECHGLARVSRRNVTLTDGGWKEVQRLVVGLVNDVMIGEVAG